MSKSKSEAKAKSDKAVFNTHATEDMEELSRQKANTSLSSSGGDNVDKESIIEIGSIVVVSSPDDDVEEEGKS